MSTQSKTMPVLDLKMYVKVVAAVFSISSATALVLALLRLLTPNLFYSEALVGTNLVIHYLVTGLMVAASGVGLLNSLVVVRRGGGGGGGGGADAARNVTTWLLLDSVFETTRVVYVFVCHVVLRSRGELQLYDLLISAAQYLLDSFLYCQMILRH